MGPLRGKVAQTEELANSNKKCWSYNEQILVAMKDLSRTCITTVLSNCYVQKGLQKLAYAGWNGGWKVED